MIQFNRVVVLHPDTEIIHPPPDVKEEGCIPLLHGYPPTPPGQATQFGFESMDSFFTGFVRTPPRGDAPGSGPGQALAFGSYFW